MSLSISDRPATDLERPRTRWGRVARRYAPFVTIATAVGLAVAIWGGPEDGAVTGTGPGTGGNQEVASQEELISSGPMTPQRAELEGVEVDFGPRCDTERGRIMLPTVLAPPCVEPFSGDNGGATSPGVTADEVKIVYYEIDPAVDPSGAALASATGADVDPETSRLAVQDYVELYNEVFETYGRRVVVERYVGTGSSEDTEAARADARAIAEREPFAVVGGPQQASAVFAAELASQGIICGPVCAQSLPEQLVDEYYPYLWQTGPTPNQTAALAAELFGNLAGPGPAELAGDPRMREQDRVYALAHFDNTDGDHRPVFEALRDQLAENGIELETDVEFTLDTTRMQESARTIISRLQGAGVTTVIYYGDPLTAPALTQEATAQGYRPEWLLGPNVLMDTTIFARQADPDQWKNGFGMAINSARGERSTSDPWRIYEWAYGEPPANNTVGIIEPRLRTIFTGIHLAGARLTPETFRDGLYRYPVSGGGPTSPQVSRGNHGVWPEDVDNGGIDDAGILWWDPEATGEDETGQQGQGMYRYANGGQRYTIGEFPTSPEEAGLFDVESSVTVYDELPEEDRLPDYPAPDVGPPTGGGGGGGG
jgi:ABC-type branched-subunit amino acid transport system substrate-binding protein